jgi:hypothetical protein
VSAQDPNGYASDRPPEPPPPDLEDEAEAVRTANRFDIRRLIGGLFVLYALILLALGIFGSHAIKTKAAGININLWTGLGMLIFGALMIFWALARPVAAEPSETVHSGSAEPGATA